MNERIRELAEQAGEEAVKSVPFFRTGRCQIPTWVNVFIEVRDKKFAELIVRECIKITRPDTEYPNEGNDWEQGFYVGKEDSSGYIKEHFGVEE